MTIRIAVYITYWHYDKAKLFLRLHSIIIINKLHEVGLRPKNIGNSFLPRYRSAHEPQAVFK